MKISFPGATFEVGPNVVALAALLIPVIMVLAQGFILYKQKQTQEHVKEVVNQVRTMNGMTVGQMLEENESRRIHEIPESDRTKEEAQHILDVPLNN